jgi:hypothetical protein
VGNPGFDFAIESGEGFVLVVFRVIGSDLHSQNVVRVKPSTAASGFQRSNPP